MGEEEIEAFPKGTIGVCACIYLYSIYGLEFALRAILCFTFRAFCYTYDNIVDLLAAAPLAFRLFLALVFTLFLALVFTLTQGAHCGKMCTILLCFVLVVRAWKALRRFEAFQSLLDDAHNVVTLWPVCISALFMLATVASAVASPVYLVEPLR